MLIKSLEWVRVNLSEFSVANWRKCLSGLFRRGHDLRIWDIYSSLFRSYSTDRSLSVLSQITFGIRQRHFKGRNFRGQKFSRFLALSAKVYVAKYFSTSHPRKFLSAKTFQIFDVLKERSIKITFFLNFKSDLWNYSTKSF